MTLLVGIVLFIILIYSVVLHEVAHGFMARSMGDRTAEYLGRLTLNPLKHLDPIGSIILPLFLVLIRSPFIFGYAKPVPYNPRNLSNKKYGPGIVALAGPATNLLVAALGAIVFRVLGLDTGEVLGLFIGYLIWINLLLAFFNLLPVPPLDGHWLALTFLPGRFNTLKMALYRYQWALFLIVVFFIFPMLFPLLDAIFVLLTGMPLF